MERFHLVLLETNGNQAYIFSTNRQRENVGASYLTTLLRVWVKAWCDTHPGLALPLMITSGKAIVTVTGGLRAAEDLITEVTLGALDEAPGLDVTGAALKVDPADVESPAGQNDVLRALDTALADYNADRPTPLARFAQLPFVKVCADAQTAASRWMWNGTSSDPRTRSAASRW